MAKETNSPYLKVVNDFSKYIEKEFISPSKGERAIFITAVDSYMSDSTFGMLHTVMGQNGINAKGVALVYHRDDDARKIINVGRTLAMDLHEEYHNIKSYSHQKNFYLGVNIVSFLWLIAVVCFGVFGIASWHTTISNIILTCVTICFTYSLFKSTKTKLAFLKGNIREGLMYSGAVMADEIQKQKAKHQDDYYEDDDED